MDEPVRPGSLTESQAEDLKRFAGELVQRRLSAAAIFMLESAIPMNFVLSQGMVFFSPVVKIVFEGRTYDRVRELLEKRETIPYIVDLIEFLDDQQKKRAPGPPSKRPSGPS
jgi:hypothetical protein